MVLSIYVDIPSVFREINYPQLKNKFYTVIKTITLATTE